MRRTVRRPDALCVACLALVFANPTYAQTAPGIARKAFASTVLLVMEDATGQALSLGSGFFVRDGEIASNLHVVEGAVRGYAKLVGQKTKYEIQGISAVDPGRDLVVLRTSAIGVPALVLGNSEAVQVGEPVFAVGNPQGLEGTFSQGIVSSIREVGPGKLLQITAPISPGSSGGPVLDGKGVAIGVSVATFRGGQNLNFAIPSTYLKTLLAGAEGDLTRPLGKVAHPDARDSILAGLGGRNSEAVVGVQVSWRWEYNQTGQYSFSLKNQLREDVRDVSCLVVFYGRDGDPVDYDFVKFPGIIPAGLAKRLSSDVDPSVQEMTTKRGSKTPDSQVEVRILDFSMVD